jgi:hypothetical protein
LRRHLDTTLAAWLLALWLALIIFTKAEMIRLHVGRWPGSGTRIA